MSMVLAGAVALAGAVKAENVSFEMVMSPKQAMKMDFKDGSKHFVLLVQREGKSTGSGPLAGTAVTEFGMHDIRRGVDGDPRGYLRFAAANGDEAYVKWRVRAIFVPGTGGKPKILDYGYWEIAGGTGQFKDLKGVGTMTIKGVSKTDRKFTLTGDVVAAK